MHASFDVLVIGGGAAGVAAALRAKAGGASVALLRAGPGASAVTSGGWAGPMDPVLSTALAEAGLPYVPASQPLPHPFGDLRTFDFAAASHACELPVDSALLCGIAGFSGFAAAALSRLYATSSDAPLAHIVVEARDTPAGGWSAMSLASALERDPLLFADSLRASIGPSVTHVLLPAVLGLENGSAVRSTLSTALGVPVFECLGAPPSIPGWRLDRALMRALQNAGIELITGVAHGCDADAGNISRVHVSVDGSARVMSAGSYVLATGKFLGGGIATLPISAREQALVETALGLPVWIEHLNQSFSMAESLTLTSRVRTYDQPLLRAGVHTNANLQAIDARGRILYNNLAVAGTVRADVDAQAGLGFASAVNNG